ncbi:protein IQ-DOMAIN 32 [Pistacia vera]|uniref:protein IQ-DOMAIN 32 n=1 Tax=Pistacia vera TaxID=55513 RepID=UPI001263AC8A|nr:protein IQ-DOMAIN 32 [Pistacia vera]
MGRSTSCLKIITCGSDSADKDDPDFAENKGANDKRGWSFRKRSARHRVLSNTVISETPLSAKKESPESADVNYQPPNNSSVPEKISMVQCIDEKPQLSTPVELKVSETIVVTDTESKHDSIADESVVTVIQAAVRGFLAKRELRKLKNVVKLQAAVRGHLVRRHAVGTLRCVQAIVKMQALVRARRARLSLNSSSIEKKEKEDSVSKPNETYVSMEKLHSNSFARQLMESTPKTKPINIKCDPAKSDSAWNWLERWMSALATKQSPKTESTVEQPEKEKTENFASPVETIHSEVLCDSVDVDSKSSARETVMPSESEENLMTTDADNFVFQPCQPTSSMLRDDMELCQPENTSTSDVNEIPIEMNSHHNQVKQSEEASQKELNSLSSNPVIESEQPKRSMKRLASDNLETEGKKFVFGSRKSGNSSFIAAQSKFEELSLSKFEELSLSANSGRSICSVHQDISVDSNVDTVSSGADTLTRTKDLDVTENSVSRFYGGSECGTELSVTSTLDSPDRSEVGTREYENEAKVTGKEIYDPTNSDNLDVKGATTFPVSDESHSVVDQPEKVDEAQVESVTSATVVDSPPVEHKPEGSSFDVHKPEGSSSDVHKPEGSSSDVHKVPDSETGRQTYRSSPEASPRSHMTVPESQGTPSSQVSVKTKNNRTEKSGSNRKRKPLSANKGSPSNPNHDSGARSSTEQLPKDQKNGKRRSSFGSTKTDYIDQEPGDSSSSSSLPHFMQATESARAKLQANNSPRSSPDVQDRDFYIKKRHSLPVANGRQGSPRIQRSSSQAQQGAKGNGTQPLHERKWQR